MKSRKKEEIPANKQIDEEKCPLLAQQHAPLLRYAFFEMLKQDLQTDYA